MRSITSRLLALQVAGGLLVVAVLYPLFHRQALEAITADFAKRAEIVATALARSVEPALVERDLTTVQSGLDAVALRSGRRVGVRQGSERSGPGAHVRPEVPGRARRAGRVRAGPVSSGSRGRAPESWSSAGRS